MKIYTRTGDRGDTGLFGGARVRKDDPRVEAYGALDELNAVLGMARAAGCDETLRDELEARQAELFILGAEIACVPAQVSKLRMTLISDEHVAALERSIDAHEEALPELKTFVLPAGSSTGATLHFARTVARRAERRCLSLHGLRPEVVQYLNRLSDYLFVVARHANLLDKVPETPWLPQKL